MRRLDVWNLDFVFWDFLTLTFEITCSFVMLYIAAYVFLKIYRWNTGTWAEQAFSSVPSH